MVIAPWMIFVINIMNITDGICGLAILILYMRILICPICLTSTIRM